MTLAILVILAITIVVMLISAEYFEVALSIVNRFFPQGYAETANSKIPNKNFATFLYPKSLSLGGHISQWVQYLLVIPVFFEFGWLVALIYLIFILFVWKFIAALLLVKNQITKKFALELMRVNLERKVAKNDFDMHGLTPEGMVLMKDLFKQIIAFIDSLPEHKVKSTQRKT